MENDKTIINAIATLKGLKTNKNDHHSKERDAALDFAVHTLEQLLSGLSSLDEAEAIKSLAKRYPNGITVTATAELSDSNGC